MPFSLRFAFLFITVATAMRHFDAARAAGPDSGLDPMAWYFDDYSYDFGFGGSVGETTGGGKVYV